MRSKGKVVTWKDDRGFGLIEPFDGGEQVFLHVKAFANRGRRPVVGDVIYFSLSKDNQGRIRAANVYYAGEKPAAKSPKRKGNISTAPAWVFFAIVAASVMFTGLSPDIPLVYVVVSLVTFIAYAIDKWAAVNDRWRTAEGTLHMLALVGGWPGALIAQKVFRHKSRKAAFRTIFWATVILNCAAFIWLHTADGRALLEQATVALP